METEGVLPSRLFSSSLFGATAPQPDRVKAKKAKNHNATVDEPVPEYRTFQAGPSVNRAQQLDKVVYARLWNADGSPNWQELAEELICTLNSGKPRKQAAEIALNFA